MGLDHPVIGYRSWFCTMDGYLKGRYSRDYFWLPGDNRAVCMRKEMSFGGADHDITERPPVHDCYCGIHAHHELEVSRKYSEAAQQFCVFGIIKGWGKIEVAPDGWRSELAEIKAMLMLESLDAHRKLFTKRAAERYNVPVLNGDSPGIDTMAGEFGKFVPHELRPEARSTRAHRISIPFSIQPIHTPFQPPFQPHGPVTAIFRPSDPQSSSSSTDAPKSS